MRYLPFTLGLIALLSYCSGYALPSLTDSSWETALFLTPVGILKNLAEGNTLSTFYSDLNRGQGELPKGLLRMGMGLAYLGLVFAFYRLAAALRKGGGA